LIFFFPSLGVSSKGPGETQWMGVFTNKNSLGQAAMIFSLYFLWSLFQKKRKKNTFLDAFLLLLSAFVLIGSLSVTSIFAFFFGLGAYTIIRMAKINIRYISLTIVYFFVMIGILFSLVQTVSMKGPVAPKVVDAFGKDMTFTGRTTLWSELWPTALKRPFLGHGFGGFWVLGNENRPRKESSSPPMSGHNGYLDVFLEMGIIGLVIMVLVILNTFIRISRHLSMDFDYAQLRLVLFLSILLHNVTETSLCQLTDPLWVWFLFSAASLPAFYKLPTSVSIRLGLPFFRKCHIVSGRAR
jgi:exopolysaccharide production protein ExoQ